MRMVTLSKREFDTIVYPLVAMAKPDSVANLKTASAVLDYLEGFGTQRELKREEIDAGGDQVLAFYEADDETVELELEDAWHDFLVRRVKEGAKTFTAIKGRECLPLLDKLEKGGDDA